METKTQLESWLRQDTRKHQILRDSMYPQIIDKVTFELYSNKEKQK